MRNWLRWSMVVGMVLVVGAARVGGAADVTEDAPPAKAPAANKGKLVASEFCPYGTIGSPVGVSVDDQGRVFVTETHRRNVGELDIRKHMDFLVGTLACRTVEEKRAFIRANYHKGEAGDANKDGVQDWRDLVVPSERVNLLVDADGDGRFDKAQVFADKFDTEITGVAGGVLAFGGHVYTTIQPDLWRLTDTTGAGAADGRVSLSHGHGVHIGFGGHDMHGPAMGPDGRVYWSQGDKGFDITSKEGRTFARQYEGAVFRVEPDGSNLEVYAHGLRNVQEIAFDDFGNLFGVDNDADLNDKERLVFITEDSDSGWRSTYQYRSHKIPGVSPGGYNPWMAEDLWRPRFDTQAAYVTPPLTNYSDGPCGFKFNPGGALSEEYRGHFFQTHFPKKLLTTFRVEPDGAAFKMVDERVAFSGLMMTGIAFGPDGAIYAADWGENAWAPHQKGRVARIDVPGGAPSAMRVETRRLLAEGMSKRSVDELAAFMGHGDQRVRVRAQFEMVSRVATEATTEARPLQRLGELAKTSESQIARVHAVWALGQLARQLASGDRRTAAIAELTPLLRDKDAEVRAQAAKVLGDAKVTAAADGLAGLLADAAPRVRFHTAIALSKVARQADVNAVVAMLVKEKSRDPFVRHAAIVALAGAAAGDAAPVAALSAHENRQVRLAAVVALRRLGSPLVERFLDDKDEWVVAEAARAIHDDTSIPEAMPALARLLERRGIQNEATVRRSINANLRVRLADDRAAVRLAEYATGNGPPRLRADAVEALGWFAAPPKLDRVEGRYRDLARARDDRVPMAALRDVVGRLLNDRNAAVREAMIHTVEQLDFKEAVHELEQVALTAAEPARRTPAVVALHALKSPKAREAAEAGLTFDDPPLRAASIGILADVAPEAPSTLDLLRKALADPGDGGGASLVERQAAVAALGRSKDKRLSAMLSEWTDRLVAGTVPPALQLDVLEAAAATKDKSLASKVQAYRAAKPKTDLLAPHVEALEGGDPVAGQAVFASGQCTQCHAVNGAGGNVGPDLSHVAARLSRRDLLESIVLPNAKIAEGFATVTVTTKEGDSYTGTVQSQTAGEVVLKDAAGGAAVTVKRADVESQTAPTSAMPPMAEVLGPREVRDVVAYLAGLK